MYLELGNADKADAMIEELRVAAGGSIPSGPPELTVKLLNGRIALLRGQLDQARRTIAEVLEAHLRLSQKNPAVIMTRLYLADIALRSKQPAEAATLAQRALEEAQGLQRGIRYSSRTGMSYLRLAEARLAQGDVDHARQALTLALEHLNAALGPDHSATQRAIALETRMTLAGLRESAR